MNYYPQKVLQCNDDCLWLDEVWKHAHQESGREDGVQVEQVQLGEKP